MTSVLLLALPLTVAETAAQEGTAQGTGLTATPWAGKWNAENTLLTVSVQSDGSSFIVEPIETMGLVWQTRDGHIEGNTATIEVEYQGVSARILVNLVNQDTAVARALSCQPDYHVICALVKNQQARFLRID